MTRLKAVLFDIDDTLFPTTEFARRARRNAVRAMVDAGLALDEGLVFRELEEVIAEFSSNYEHHYDKLVRRLRVEGLTPRRTAPIVAAGVAAYHDTKMREIAPFEDVPPLLDDLRDAGLRLGVITHGWSVKQAEKLVRLGLISFFTVGEDEVRAWTIRSGSRAPQAGRAIHQDIEHGFIRTEMMRYQDLLELGSEQKVKEAGKLTQKGKDHVVEDGEIHHFLFKV